MANDSRSSLTAADLTGWLGELRQISVEMDKMRARQSDLQRKVEAARILFPQLFDQKAPVEPLNSTDLQTWNDLIYFALAGERGGRTQRFMLEVGKRTNLADRVKQSPNGIYNATARMVEMGDLVKVGQLFYLPDIHARIEAGELIEEPEEGAQSNGTDTASLVLQCLTDCGPLAPADIYTHLKQVGDTASRSYLYTLLSRLITRGLIEKVGNRYAMPNTEKGSDESEPSLDLDHRESTAGTRGLSLVHSSPSDRR